MKTMKKLILMSMILTGIQLMACTPYGGGCMPRPVYSIKDDTVYWGNLPLNGKVDLNTLTIITKEGEDIPLKNYLKNHNNSREIESFFIKDKNNVYYQGRKFEGADPKTFKALGDNLFKDKNNVYSDTKKIKGVDVKTFKVLGNYYFKDKNNVYYYHYYYDDDDVSNYIIKGSDPKTFKVLTDIYSRDKNNAYYYNKEIKGSDPNTFKILEINDYSKDKSNVYYKGEKIEGADSATFELTGINVSHEAKDKNHKYLLGKIVNDD